MILYQDLFKVNLFIEIKWKINEITLKITKIFMSISYKFHLSDLNNSFFLNIQVDSKIR